MKNIVIDIGNSAVKVAIFEDGSLLEVDVVADMTEEYLRDKWLTHGFSQGIISSVRPDCGEWERFLLTLSVNCRIFTTSAYTGISMGYLTPETLGLDRFAAVIGARYLYANADCLIIDAGTCVTYDFIDSNAHFAGGSIAPGIQMRFRALNAFTGKLPLLDPGMDTDFSSGVDTNSAMRSGVLLGITYEAEGFIARFLKKYPNLQVLLCGGDVKFFDRQLKNSIFADRVKTEPHLVLYGLNEVLHHL